MFQMSARKVPDKDEGEEEGEEEEKQEGGQEEEEKNEEKVRDIYSLQKTFKLIDCHIIVL